MFNHLKPQYITLNRRRHLSFGGEVYPSITTILSATKPQRDREALQRWRKRVGVKQAQQIATNAARRGISIHTAIQQYLASGEANPEILDNPFWHSIEPVLNRVEEVYLQESAVYHALYRYGGCFDCLGLWEGELCLFDWKTASKPKKQEWITDYCLQVTAYIRAVNYLYKAEIQQGIIAIALADSDSQVFTLDKDALEDYWQQFLVRLRQWNDRAL